MLLMREATSQSDIATLDAGGEELAARINQLNEPYRSNTVDWLEERSGRRFEDLEEDLPRYLNQMEPGARAMTVTMLHDLLAKALRYFSTGGRSWSSS
ncbi:MAG: hypothetical protein R3191_02910 [Anaerolineales bacterium]|nr:hypothetical protein [Anaerolineales bacterium]